jgi:hypothetical protein
MSNRFALKRFLGLTEEEIAENERLWREENEENVTELVSDDLSGEMRMAGLSGADLAGDTGGLETELDDAGTAIDGGTGEEPTTNTDQDIGGAPPANPAQTI